MSIDSRATSYGKIFGDWTLHEIIGKGSNGKTIVYRVTRRNRTYKDNGAIKIINIIEQRGKKEEYSPEFLKQYESLCDKLCRDAEKELKVMHLLGNSANIVNYHDYNFEPWDEEYSFGKDLLIRMDLLNSLEQLKRKCVLSEEEILKIGIDISNALICCHDKDVIHRDIKPDNIFYTEYEYMLGDFGISKMVEGMSTAETHTGTAAYAAPEQSMSNYNYLVDIYSLGLTLYELANENKLPFAKSIFIRPDEIQLRLNGKPLPKPTGVSEALAKVILKACAYKPEDRYQSAAELKEALESIKLSYKKKDNVREENRNTARIRSEQSGKDVYATVAALEEEKADMYETAAALEEEKPDMYETVAALEEEKPDMYETVAALEEDKPDMYETVAALEEDKPNMYETAEALEEEKPDMYETVAALETGKPDMYETVAALEADKPDMYETVAALETGKPDMYETVAALETGKPDMYETVAALETGKPDMYETVAALAEEKTDNTAHVCLENARLDDAVMKEVEKVLADSSDVGKNQNVNVPVKQESYENQRLDHAVMAEVEKILADCVDFEEEQKVSVSTPYEVPMLEESTSPMDMLRIGHNYFEKGDYVKAVDWYRQAISQGNIEALYELGVCFMDGLGVEQDIPVALNLFISCAERCEERWIRGLAELRIGQIYEEKGRRKERKISERWYRKSAEDGNPYAMKRFHNGKFIKR